MAINYNGTTLANVVYNGTDLDEVWVCCTSCATCTKVFERQKNYRLQSLGSHVEYFACSFQGVDDYFTINCEWTEAPYTWCANSNCYGGCCKCIGTLPQPAEGCYCLYYWYDCDGKVYQHEGLPFLHFCKHYCWIFNGQYMYTKQQISFDEGVNLTLPAIKGNECHCVMPTFGTTDALLYVFPYNTNCGSGVCYMPASYGWQFIYPSGACSYCQAYNGLTSTRPYDCHTASYAVPRYEDNYICVPTWEDYYCRCVGIGPNACYCGMLNVCDWEDEHSGSPSAPDYDSCWGYLTQAWVFAHCDLTNNSCSWCYLPKMCIQYNCPMWSKLDDPVIKEF